jgi:hypothetical protein
MNAPDPYRRSGGAPRPPHGAGNSGLLVLALLAIASFCGWYLIVSERPGDTNPLRVVQKPLMPPTSTDTSADVPGHEHYMVLSPSPGQADTRQR